MSNLLYWEFNIMLGYNKNIETLIKNTGRNYIIRLEDLNLLNDELAIDYKLALWNNVFQIVAKYQPFSFNRIIKVKTIFLHEILGIYCTFEGFFDVTTLTNFEEILDGLEMDFREEIAFLDEPRITKVKKLDIIIPWTPHTHLNHYRRIKDTNINIYLVLFLNTALPKELVFLIIQYCN